MTLRDAQKEESLESEHYAAKVVLYRSDRFGGTFVIVKKYYKKASALFGLVSWNAFMSSSRYKPRPRLKNPHIHGVERAKDGFSDAVDQASERLGELEHERAVLDG